MHKRLVRCWSDATRAIHSGESKRGLNAPVTTPIGRTSNFNFASTAELKRFAEGKSKAYLYTRYGNPTLAGAEAEIAEMENGETGLVKGSGMAAISSALLCGLKIPREGKAHRARFVGVCPAVLGDAPGAGQLP